MADEIVAAYAAKLFIRSEAEIRRPVVLLTGERTNVYGVLEKHFRETALPPSERFWRTVRTQWTPQLETWRPRVNGVQLKVLAGARLPESEEEWGTLRGALSSLRQHLRSDSSVDRLVAELRDFVQMVVAWWENRKKTEGGGAAMGINGLCLMKRVASSGLMLGGMPLAKKPCMEFMQLQSMPAPPGAAAAAAAAAQGAAGMYPPPPVYAAPEIVQHTLLGGAGGSGRLPDRVQMVPVDDHLHQHQRHHGRHGDEAAVHGGGGYLQQLASNSEAQLFGDLFNGDSGAGRGGSQSPRDGGLANGSGGSGHLAQHAHDAAAVAAGMVPVPVPMEPAGMGGYYLQPHQDETSPEQKEAVMARQTAAESKRFVTLNVGGHRFLTTVATLAAVDGSYFAKLAHQATAGSSGSGSRSGGSGTSEFFVDRSGKLFEYVLDYLRSQRFCDAASSLPKDDRTLQLLAREAEFYQLPGLADRVRGALAVAAVAAGQGDDTPSDMPANIAAEGSAHGGHLLAGRFGAAGAPAGTAAMLATHQQLQLPAQLDALFLETGFQQAAALAEAQASLLHQLNSMLQAKQAEGYVVVECQCGTEREGALRNLHYHVLLRKTATA